MLLPQAAIPSLPDNLKWEVVPIDRGESYLGWAAGPVQVVATHWTGGASRPCRWRMTSGALPCACQVEPIKVRVIGYLPVRDKFLHRSVLILSATVAEDAKKLKHGDAVKLFRPARGNRPLVLSVVSDDHGSSAIGVKMKAAKPVDVGEYLLHLWQDRLLTEHLGCKYHPSATAFRRSDDKSAAA